MKSDYQRVNNAYWQSEYETQYPDTSLVKLYHHVLKRDPLFIPRGRVLDYGCGNGANARFFASMGCDVNGVDVNQIAIEKVGPRAPFRVRHIPFACSLRDKFGGPFDLIVAWHTLYYLSDSDLEVRLENLHRQLLPGGFFVATMVGAKTANFAKTKPAEDGMREFPIIDRLRGIHGKPHFVNFTHDEADLLSKFKLFEPKHVGYLDECFSGADNLFHYIFVGVKNG